MSSTQEKKLLNLTFDNLRTQVRINQAFMATATVAHIHMARAHYEQALEVEKEFKILSTNILKYNGEVVDEKEEINLSKMNEDLLDTINTVKGKYFKLATDFSAANKPQNSGAAPHTQQMKPNLKVKYVEVPDFSGDLNEWQNFYSIFNGIVHTSNYYGLTEKFSILKTHLKGDAASVIKGFQFIDSNYQKAYDSLVKTYENQRLHASFHVNNILGYKCDQKFTYKSFLNHHKNTVDSLKNLKLQNNEDFLLFEMVFRNLKPKDQKEFNDKNKSVIPTYDELITFLEKKVENELLSTNSLNSNINAPASSGGHSHSNKSNDSKSSRTLVTSEPVNCFKCNASHLLYKCSEFKDLGEADRVEFVKKNKLCYSCLRRHKGSCKLTITCFHCKGNHNTLLHYIVNLKQVKNNEKENSEKSDKDKNNEKVNVTLQNNFIEVKNFVENAESKNGSIILSNYIKSGNRLLGTVACFVKNDQGEILKLRGLIDNCSQANLISASVIADYNFKFYNVPTQVSGVGDNAAKGIGFTRLTLFNHNFSVSGYFKIVPKITGNCPTENLPLRISDSVKGIQLADPDFSFAKPIDVLLDVEMFCQLLDFDPDRGDIFEKGVPSRLRTKWGWVILGAIRPDFENNISDVLLAVDPIAHALNRFFETEEIEVSSCNLKKDEQKAEKVFEETLLRDQDGRYIVTLPEKDANLQLPSNRLFAVRNFQQLENSFKKDENLRQKYHAFMQEYIKLNHMRLAKEPVNYIHPQHLILNEQRSSTKLRVVFDASAEIQGLSLNKNLLPGKKLQKDLTHILMVFRTHAITLTADIEKMYRQIKVNENQLHLQHVFYREAPDLPLLEYELLTVTYGQTSAPYLALKVLEHLSKTYESNYPLAANTLKNRTYIDDVASGGKDVEEVKRLKNELVEINQKAGFKLKKWTSNSEKVLEGINEEDIEPIKAINESTSGLKVLGLNYVPKEDLFIFFIEPFKDKFTKRKILGYISSIYDIMGFLAPITFTFKLCMQEIWKSGINWDAKPEKKFREDWSSYINQVAELPIIKVSRYINPCGLILVAFSDASQVGMCTVVYAVNAFHSDLVSECSKNFLMSKTKVSPLKPKLSIPKLELNAAVMSVKLVNHILKSELSNKINQVYFFTDSEIVLHWLIGDKGKLKTFEANRIAYIENNAGKSVWNYCPGKENPADLGTRKFIPGKIIDNEMWFHGPDFLKQKPEDWELDRPQLRVEFKQPEVVLLTQENDNPFYYLIEKFSSFEKLTRVVSYALRFIDRKIPSRKPNASVNKSATLAVAAWEIERATQVVVKLSQREFFSEDIQKLQKGKLVSEKLNKLTPFIDENKVVRARGRLIHAPLPPETKYPIIIPKKCSLANLIIASYHRITLHSGTRTTQSLIAKKFHILGSRDLIRRFINKCIVCKRFTLSKNQQLMGDLPKGRTVEEYPFENVFIDFAGPFDCKDRHKTRPVITKGYLMVVISLSIKAVHLEFVSELSTPAFLDAFGRFTARRNVPKNVFTDNGSNFKGASKTIKEVAQFLENNREDIFSSLATQGIHWQFSPPYASNMNGLVEAAVKSAKGLMYKQIQLKKLTYEEYSSLFCRIESILNSRPLVLQNSSGGEPDFLCPNNFIFLKSPVPEPDEVFDENQILRCKFKRISQEYQKFWRRFKDEYLNTLIQRNKWVKEIQNPVVGDLVLMKEMNTKPLAWPIGRIVKVHPGLDGKIRVVDINTANGLYKKPIKITEYKKPFEYKRPVNKLIILDVK